MMRDLALCLQAQVWSYGKPGRPEKGRFRVPLVERDGVVQVELEMAELTLMWDDVIGPTPEM